MLFSGSTDERNQVFTSNTLRNLSFYVWENLGIERRTGYGTENKGKRVRCIGGYKRKSVIS